MSAALIIWGAGLGVQDIRNQRISNAGLLLVAIPAVALLLATGSGLLHQGPLDSALGLLLALLVMLPGYGLGQVGGGDVKLAALIGLLLGPIATAMALLLAGLIWGAVAALRLGARQQSRYALAPVLISGFGLVLVLPWLQSLWS